MTSLFYRLSKKLSTVFWQGASPVRRSPAFYVFDTQEKDTVPLYEYFHDTPGSNDYRYETASWDLILTGSIRGGKKPPISRSATCTTQ